MKKSIVLGFVCAMAGICLITFQKGETVELNPLGDFLGVAAAASGEYIPSVPEK